MKHVTTETPTHVLLQCSTYVVPLAQMLSIPSALASLDVVCIMSSFHQALCLTVSVFDRPAFIINETTVGEIDYSSLL